MAEKDITQNILMKEILDELKILQSNMPSGDIKIMQGAIEDVKKDQKALKDDMSDIKRKLLDPDDGVIVKVNQNTKFRLQEEGRYDDYMQFNIDMNDLKKWKEGVNKALWIIFATLIGIGLKLLFGKG